jgi:CRISPR-associated protein Cas2
MFVLVSYDIPDDRRRTRVMKTLKNFGAHVQYSVFECRVSAKDYRRLREQLGKLINHREDSVRFYVLCQEDVKKRRVWGVERVEADPRSWYLVGGSSVGAGEG